MRTKKGGIHKIPRKYLRQVYRKDLGITAVKIPSFAVQKKQRVKPGQ
jgi:hypothetical protein